MNLNIILKIAQRSSFSRRSYFVTYSALFEMHTCFVFRHFVNEILIVFADYLGKLFVGCGYEIVENEYVKRRTVNRKEGIDVPRVFVQAKFIKPK